MVAHTNKIASYLWLALYNNRVFQLPYNHPWRLDSLVFNFEGSAVVLRATHTQCNLDSAEVRICFDLTRTDVPESGMSEFIAYLVAHEWTETTMRI